MTTTDLAARTAPGELATAAPIDSFQILDHIAGGLVAPREQQPTLATISAGYMGKSRNGNPTPVVSRDGTIYVGGKENLRAAFDTVPGLATALQAGKRKRLTIAFPFDDPALFIQQRFARYSATALELYGDQHGLTRIRTVGEEGRTRTVHEHLAPDSDEFAQAMEYVKTQTSVYFLLAEWRDGVARVVMPDGAGLYRLRMTSRNSVNGIVNSLRWIAKLTGGRIAGIPFDLFLENHDVVAPDGKRRDVPVWQLVMKPPKQLELTTANFQQVMADALEQGQRLRVLPPPSETAEYAALDAPDIDLDSADVNDRSERQPEPPLTARTIAQRDLDLVARGGLCNAAKEQADFFRSFNHTDLRHKEIRAEVIREFTNGRVASLRDYLADATTAEARALYIHCVAWVERQKAPPLKHADQTDSSSSTAFMIEKQEAVPQVIDTETGEIHEPADDPWGDLGESESVDQADEPTTHPKDDDWLSVRRQRGDDIERAADAGALALAWSDVERDADYLGAEAVGVLREAYTGRQAELQQAKGGRR